MPVYSWERENLSSAKEKTEFRLGRAFTVRALYCYKLLEDGVPVDKVEIYELIKFKSRLLIDVTHSLFFQVMGDDCLKSKELVPASFSMLGQAQQYALGIYKDSLV